MSLPRTEPGAVEDPFRSVWRGATTRGLAVFLGRAAGFATTVVLVRELARAEAGTFLLGLAVAALVSRVVALGLPEAVARVVAPLSGPEAGGATLARSLRVAGASGFAAVAVGVAVYLLGGETTVAIAAPAMAWALSGQAVVAAYLRARTRVVAAELTSMLGSVLFLAALPVVLAATRRGADALWIRVLVEGVVFAGALFLVRRALGARTEPAPPPGLMRLAMPLWLTTLAWLVLQQADVVLLGAFDGASAVGTYAPVLRVADLAAIPFGFLGAYVLPAAARARAAGPPSSVRDLYVRSSKMGFALSTPILAAMLVAPERVLSILFGFQDPDLVLVARLLTLAHVLNATLGLNGVVLEALGARRELVLRAGIGLAAGLAADLVLIPPLGMLGAALGTLVGMVVLNVSTSVLLWSRHDIPPLRRDMLWTVAAGTAGTAGLWLLHRSLAHDAVLGAGAVAVAAVTLVVGMRSGTRNAASRVEASVS